MNCLLRAGHQLARANAIAVAFTLAAPAIVGCSVLTPPALASQPLTTAAAPTPAPTRPNAGAGPDESADRERGALPEIDLTGPLLFQIMAAEVALQRGDAGAAYATYLSAARSTRDPRLARRAGEIALVARASAQALEAVQLWFELAPDSREAKQATAALLIANGRHAEAAPLLEEQLKQAADPVDELARIQRTLARGPDRAGAFTILDGLAQPYRDDARRGFEVRLILANGAHAAGLAKRSVEEARAALALRPDSERAALVTAQFLARPEGKDSVEGRAQALALLQEFLLRNPDAVEVRAMYARLLVADNSFAQAREQFAEVLKRDARNLDALYALGVLTMDGKPPRTESRRYFEQFVEAVEQAPGAGRDPDPAYLNLARLAEDERRYDEALRWLARIDEGEQYVAARARQALVLGKMRRVDEARKLLTETAAQPARSSDERIQLALAEGQLLRGARRYQDAFDTLATALKQTPDNTNLLYDTAMAAEKLDRIDVMETHLRQMMKLRPDDAHAYNALGYTFADRNVRLAEALELVSQALKLSPTDAYILDSMGWVHFRIGDLAKARDYLERAWQQRPEAEVGAHLGEVLWQMGARDDARRIWRAAAAADQDNESLRSALQRLKVKL